MRRLRHPGVVMGLFALGLEANGVASGAYVYGDFPLKIFGVPLLWNYFIKKGRRDS
ncbi:hypothetical protein ES703_124410 [subsurface metagenome]